MPTVPNHTYKPGKSYLAQKGQNRVPIEIKVVNATDSYILIQEVKYDESEGFSGWVASRDYIELAEIPPLPDEPAKL